jgi:catechol 2,3-dioxygenase-like lactoylglutathione lyase family enzyme
MFDHIGLRTQKFDALAAFYEKTLAPLGYEKLMSFEGGAGFGRDGNPGLWLGVSDQAQSSVHLALAAESRSAVDAFHAAGLKAGGKDNGAPGLRDFAPNYYAAFVIDPDGNNLEAVCHKA